MDKFDTFADALTAAIEARDPQADIPCSFIDSAYSDELTVEQAVDSWFDYGEKVVEAIKSRNPDAEVPAGFIRSVSDDNLTVDEAYHSWYSEEFDFDKQALAFVHAYRGKNDIKLSYSRKFVVVTFRQANDLLEVGESIGLYFNKIEKRWFANFALGKPGLHSVHSLSEMTEFMNDDWIVKAGCKKEVLKELVRDVEAAVAHLHPYMPA